MSVTVTGYVACLKVMSNICYIVISYKVTQLLTVWGEMVKQGQVSITSFTPNWCDIMHSGL